MNTQKAFVIWAKEVKLSQFLANSLGAELVLSFKEEWLWGMKAPALIRYILQSVDTYKRLKGIKPKAVFVQNPPIFAVAVVWFYCIFNNAKFVIDTHTAGFLDRKWIFFHCLHRFFAKRAAFNTVHNYKNLEIIKGWGIENGRVLQFYNPKREEILLPETVLPENLLQTLEESAAKPKIFMVNRFANDDAWQEVVNAAKLMPEAMVFITGNDKKISQEIIKTFPSNVALTGYLPHAQFIKLMDGCDVVLALTKRKDTVLWSVREIMALQKPFVTTDSDVIRHYYGSVGIFTNHETADLKSKIEQALNSQNEVKEKIKSFLEKDKIRFERDIEFLNSIN